MYDVFMSLYRPREQKIKLNMKFSLVTLSFTRIDFYKIILCTLYALTW